MAKARRKAAAKRLKSEKLTERAILRYVGERSFRLGKEYFSSGAIFDGQQQGELLKARCQGRSADHYAVSARIKGGEVDKADCSCPVGEGGYSKHVAALLLSWLNAPKQFRETAPIEQRLAECSQERLVQLIVQLIDRQPELESWLELAMPQAKSDKGTVKSDAYRRQAVQAFESAGYGWEADRQLTAALASLKKLGDGFRSQGDDVSAASVYRGVLDGFISEFETFQDETGNIVVVAAECARGLGDCLSNLPEGSKPRRLAMQSLFDVLRYDINFGGIGLSDDIPDIFAAHANPAERAMLAGWIREQVQGSDETDSGRNWQREAWGGALLVVERLVDNDEAYIRHCRDFGLTHELVSRLLERGRLDEAMQEIRRSSDYDLMGHADLLIANKHGELALQLISDRRSTSPNSRNDWQLCDWLKRYYQSCKKWAPLLELAAQEFRRNPTLGGYREVREYAQKLKTWKPLRAELLTAIPKNSPELIQVYLEEGDVGQAVELLESRQEFRKKTGFTWGRVDLEVAKAAEKTHPETALRVYRAEADRLISSRGRENYRAACGYLKKVKRLFSALEQADDWKEYSADLRLKHRALRALQEELDRSGL